MGEIIDFDAWRRHGNPLPAGGSGEELMKVWGQRPVTYVDLMVTPSMLLWRSMFVTWACLWLAPIGLQVTAIEAQQRPAGIKRCGSQH